MTMSQKPSELLPPAAADWATVVRLKKIHKEEDGSIINRPARSTYPEKKSVLTSGATPTFSTDDQPRHKLSGVSRLNQLVFTCAAVGR
jgi:hypothetical protein